MVRWWFLLLVACAGRAQPRPPTTPLPHVEAEGSVPPRLPGIVVTDVPAAAPPPADVPADAGLRRVPSTPDPLAGGFGLAQATAGLPGAGALVASIDTGLGTLECTLSPGRAPLTVANFVGLARGLRDFWDARIGAWVRRPAYDGSTFHRVIPDFMIQGGDPIGDGTGTGGYEIPDENPTGTHDRAGLLCMANRGPNTGSIQFFITDGAAPHLRGSFTIFGSCAPLATIARIARVPRASPQDRPTTPVPIVSVRISRRPGPRTAP